MNAVVLSIIDAGNNIGCSGQVNLVQWAFTKEAGKIKAN